MPYLNYKNIDELLTRDYDNKIIYLNERGLMATHRSRIIKGNDSPYTISHRHFIGNIRNQIDGWKRMGYSIVFDFQAKPTKVLLYFNKLFKA